MKKGKKMKIAIVIVAVLIIGFFCSRGRTSFETHTGKILSGVGGEKIGTYTYTTADRSQVDEDYLVEWYEYNLKKHASSEYYLIIYEGTESDDTARGVYASEDYFMVDADLVKDPTDAWIVEGADDTSYYWYADGKLTEVN